MAESVLIRRNDYIASIKADISNMKQLIKTCDDEISSANALLDMCRENKTLRKFKKVVKYDLKCVTKEKKFYERNMKSLYKLLLKAEKYTPGSNQQ